MSDEQKPGDYANVGDRVPIGEPDPFEHRWTKLAELGDVFGEKPPERDYLFCGPLEKPIGIMPVGKVGMLAAAGGTGKTQALVQLAVSVATGLPWFGHFTIPKPGHVLLALGEEEAEEVKRRLYFVGAGLRLDAEARRNALERIVVLPLSGTDAALVDTDERGNWHTTERLAALVKRLGNAGHDWRLLALDPLSRFAGSDAEKDNAAATRFVEALETLTTARGKPAVFVAHHTSQASRQAAATTTTGARGVTGLTDGARFVMTMDVDAVPKFLAVRVTKSNYAPTGHETTIIRDETLGHVLRVAKGGDLAELEDARKEARKNEGEAAARAKNDKAVGAKRAGADAEPASVKGEHGWR